MADYWKSQPKKFCKYCKCWIADNKPSVEFHERGKNHKENVSLKIAEIKQKSLDKAKQEDRMSKEFAAMEAAAQKAYEEDMKRLGIESGSQAQTQPQSQPKAPPQVQPPPQQKDKKPKPQKSSGKGARQPVREADAWVEGKSDDGVTYYFNTVTGESQWVKPEDAETESSTSRQSESNWKEAVSPEGYTYYYNTETGESSWERPADLPTGSGSGAEVKDGESSPPKTEEPPSGAEGGAGGATGAKEGQGEGEESKQTQIPKISFRKRKEESSEKELGDEDGKEEGDEGRGGEEEDKMAAAPPVEKVPAKKPRRTTPYGAWEQIQEEVDPYEKVDLQLPQWDGASVAAPTELPKEPKPRFKERTITSLGGEGGGPAAFRKRKADNGKSRSLRQRGEDD